MADVFVSYARSDKERVAPLVSALEAEGLSVWWDPAIAAGQQFDDQIEAEMNTARSVLAIWTPTSVASRWVRGESREAADRGILVPVRFDGARLPMDVRALHTIDLDNWGNDPASPPFQDLLRALRSMIARQGGLTSEISPAGPAAGASTARAAAPGFTQSRSLTRKEPRRAIAIGAVALLVIAVAVGVRFLGFGKDTGDSIDGKLAASTAEVPTASGENSSGEFAPPPHSIAVLAFTNMSGDAKDEYFSDGLAEELLQALAQIKELKVAARTSSFSFKGANVDILTVGRKLNVGAVLEGSVRKAEGRIRVIAQLINAVSGYQIWSENFDRELKDVIALQSDIAYAVADALQVKFLGDGRVPGGTQNPKALDAFLRGRAGERIQDEKNLRAALVALDEAVALDPAFANAHALRGDVLAQLAAGYSDDPAEARRLNAEALRAVKRAVATAPNSAFAYEALGGVLLGATSDYVATDAAYRRSMELAPGEAYALKGYAAFAIMMGRADALPSIERARELDPLNPSILSNLGYVQYYARKYTEARKSMQEAMQRFDNQVTRDFAALIELASGKPAAAVPYCERDVATWSNQVCLAIAYHKLGRRKDAEAMMRRLQEENGDGAAFQYAQIYAQWARPDESIKWLEKAAEMRDPGLIAIKVDPFLDPIRKMPRFEDVVAVLNFPT